jgi:hypothetical protein
MSELKQIEINITYTDRKFKSRVLIMPDGRALRISERRISVQGGDKGAIEYLDAHPDFERVQ